MPRSHAEDSVGV